MAAVKKTQAEDKAAAGAKTVSVTVADGTQVNHAGTVYGPGETLTMPEEEAAPLLAAGIVAATTRKVRP